MPKNYELDSLKQRAQAAFENKQRLWQQYKDAKDRTSVAYNAMQQAWGEQQSARDEMNREWDSIQHNKAHNDEVWDDYRRTKDSLSYQISSLKSEADNEHREMQRCFDSASDAYEYGNKADAPYWSQQGHDHKDRRDELNAEVSRLCENVKSAKERAQYSTVRIDRSAHRSAKDRFDQAKNRHDALTSEFQRLKSERDRIKAEFDSAHEEHKRLQNAFQAKLEEIKANNQRERDKALDKAGVKWSERKDAKVVKKADGSTQVYHGGLGKGDGLGHGHTAIDKSGNVTYDRKSFSKHGSQNYTDNKKSSNWGPLNYGTIEDREVTFRQGQGIYEGQTLISDGFLKKSEFDKHHNHYGPNNKELFPNQPNFVEDSDKHKGDNFYTGPGN